MKKIKIIGAALIIMMVLCTASIKSNAQGVTNTVVQVSCASGDPKKLNNIEVHMYYADANGNAIDPCKCTQPKKGAGICSTNPAEKEKTNAVGTANFSNNTKLAPSTKYIAVVNARCISQVVCTNNGMCTLQFSNHIINSTTAIRIFSLFHWEQ